MSQKRSDKAKMWKMINKVDRLIKQIDGLIGPDLSSKQKQKQKSKPNTKKSKPNTKFICTKIWNFETNGGIFSMNKLDKALDFYNEHGFAVINDVIDEKENICAKKLLLNDLNDINKNKKDIQIDWNNINDLHKLTNSELPGWHFNGIRLQFGIAHGKFANYSRLRPNIRKIFSYFHECNENELCCSWDSIAITPYNAVQRDTLWLHADQSVFNEKNKKIKGWNYNSIQGALYYTNTNKETVSFVCCPGSHKKYWNEIAMNSKIKKKHWLLIDEFCHAKSYGENSNENDRKKWSEYRQEIMDCAYRIHVPKNGFLLWNSKTLHQNGDSLEVDKENKIKRIASFISMSANKLRDIEGFKNCLIFAINGRTSTHWSQFMIPHIGKHPRFTKGKSFENMCDVKPILNSEITEKEFQDMIPKCLKDFEVKIYNTKRKEPLSLDNVHHLSIGLLKNFKVKDLWKLMNPKIQILQPWIDP